MSSRDTDTGDSSPCHAQCQWHPSLLPFPQASKISRCLVTGHSELLQQVNTQSLSRELYGLKMSTGSANLG